jgi:hypothetical protein
MTNPPAAVADEVTPKPPAGVDNLKEQALAPSPGPTGERAMASPPAAAAGEATPKPLDGADDLKD